MGVILNLIRINYRLLRTGHRAFFSLDNCRHLSPPCCLHCHQLHTSPWLLKKERRKPTLKVKTKMEVRNIWKDMTPEQISKVTNRSLDDVLEAMEFDSRCNGYKHPKAKISNIEALRSILKMLGYLSVVVKNPELVQQSQPTNKDAVKRPPPTPEQLVRRPPVVAIMGHVDHGKTTLLDALRHSSITAKEFGGITQHIGAFTVKVPPAKQITFLDTPGHAAFSAMRARGARATDLVILVVAADDGVMEQTIESIKYANEAQVPILVAINKIDKGKQNVESLKHQLAIYGVNVEDFGGDVQAVEISALKGINLDGLVQAILIQAEIMEVGSDPTGPVEGVVLESTTGTYTGKNATVLIQRGTLRKGSLLVAGHSWTKTKILTDENNKPLDKVTPGLPVQVSGWKELPDAGEIVLEVENMKRVQEVMEWRKYQAALEKQKQEAPAIMAQREQQAKVHRDKLLSKIAGTFVYQPKPTQIDTSIDEGPKLCIVIKGDVAGSVEAILDCLSTYNQNHKCKLDITDFGVGPVTVKDIELASLFNGIVYAFNVPQDKKLAETAPGTCEIKHFNVIYHLIDSIKMELKSRLPKLDVDEEIGCAEVLQEFLINERNKKIPVAGSQCIRGTLLKSSDAFYKLVRNGTTVASGMKVLSIRHHKDEVQTIAKGLECGLRTDNPDVRFQRGDQLVCYRPIKVDQTLDWNPGF